MRTNKFISFILAIALHALVLTSFTHFSVPSSQSQQISSKVLSIDLTQLSVLPRSSSKNNVQINPSPPLSSAKNFQPTHTSTSTNLLSNQASISSNEEMSFIKMTAPRYPPLARKRELEGKVKIKAYYNSEGFITKVDILHSSGAELLDKSVQEAIYEWKVAKGVSGTFEKSFEFKLNH